MRFSYPRSFLKLLAVAFTLVALPLIVALANNAISIDRLANRSQQAVYRAAQATQSSRQLAELLTAMERAARQMVILGDRALLETYTLTRGRFLRTADEFRALPFDDEQWRALDAILRGEDAIFGVLANAGANVVEQGRAVEGFIGLADHARTITVRSNELIDHEVEAMRATAVHAQRIMLWQLLALIPVVVFLVIGFMILIAQPIRQIDSAIRRLGGGELNAKVQVTGPEDLQNLGERLEWLRRRLVELEEQKNRFLRQVSHELKTPLTALREGTELLAEEVAGRLSPGQREIAEILRRNSVELQKLIEDLLSYGASHFYRTVLELQPVRVKDVIQRVADDQKLALRAKDLRLEVNVQDVVLAADREKLRVLVDNLVSNAIKFSPLDGAVAIDARANGTHLELEVADEGPGIAHADRPHVFEPFYQGAEAERALVKGTGVGLSVVKEYAVAHGGTVEVVEGTGERGARLRVRLPLPATGDGK
jgi:two-component system, NtrC family, sensor histidine kinase GlrK